VFHLRLTETCRDTYTSNVGKGEDLLHSGHFTEEKRQALSVDREVAIGNVGEAQGRYPHTLEFGSQWVARVAFRVDWRSAGT